MNADTAVSAEYDKKKYVWKLLYIFMLGYDVEFGHKQAADLIPANKYVSAHDSVSQLVLALLSVSTYQLPYWAGMLRSKWGTWPAPFCLNEVALRWSLPGLQCQFPRRAKLMVHAHAVSAERRVHAAHHQLHT